MQLYEVVCDHDHEYQDTYGDYPLEEAIEVLGQIARVQINLNWIQIQKVGL